MVAPFEQIPATPAPGNPVVYVGGILWLPAAVAGNDGGGQRAADQVLQDALMADRFGELAQRGLVDAAARVVRPQHRAVPRDRFDRQRFGHRASRRDQRAMPTAAGEAGQKRHGDRRDRELRRPPQGAEMVHRPDHRRVDLVPALRQRRFRRRHGGALPGAAERHQQPVAARRRGHHEARGSGGSGRLCSCGHGHGGAVPAIALQTRATP
jgi:hypothetical protein